MQFGRYELIRELGKGGFGTVYLAHDTILDVDRALKVLHPVLVADSTFLSRFRQEARMAARMDHPNLVTVYDSGEMEGRYYLVMRYLPGGALKDRLEREGRLLENEALRIFSQLSQGLDYAHNTLGIVHRDLKPANILFDMDGTAYVSDMGFAKSMTSGNSASLSVSGAMVGTPAYMAPEIWRGKPATAASDIYSLGCILYEMLTGDMLFKGDSPAEMMTKHVLGSPQFSADLPEKFKPVLLKALQKNPEDRFGSVKVMADALMGAAAGGTVFQKVGEPKKQPERSPSETRSSQQPSAQQTAHQTPVEPKGTGSGFAARTDKAPQKPVEKEAVDQQRSASGPSALPRKILLWGIGGAFGIGVLILFVVTGNFIKNIFSRVVFESTTAPTSAALVQSDDQNAFTSASPTPPVPTATGRPQEDWSEVNSVAPYNVDFTFGQNPTCPLGEAVEAMETISQEALFKNEWLYLVWSPSDVLADVDAVFSVFQLNGSTYLYQDEDLYYDPDSPCGEQGFSMEDVEAGSYLIEVAAADDVLYRHTFVVTYTDLSAVPRVERPPFGEITFGRGGISSDVCSVSETISDVSLADIAEDPWFYFASPFQVNDIGGIVNFVVTDPSGGVVYDSDRTIEDDYDLCYWQGFSLEDSETGEYVLEISYEGSEIFRDSFTLKE